MRIGVKRKGQELAGVLLEEGYSFVAFEGIVPVEMVQEDSAIKDHKNGIIPQSRISENEQDYGIDEDSEGRDDETSMPRLVPKTHVENGVDNIDEDDLESEEEELDLGSDDKNQIPEFRATYQDECV